MITKYDWVIKARYDACLFLAQLNVIGNRLPAAGTRIPIEFYRIQIFENLAGAGFALWRAAFLANDENQNWEKCYTACKDMIGAILEDNAIAYSQEKKNEAWTCRFYLKAAESHLNQAHIFLGQTRFYKSAPEQPFDDTNMPPMLFTTAEIRWTRAHEKAREILNQFEMELNSRLGDAHKH